MGQTIRMFFILAVALIFEANELWKSAVNYDASIGMERKHAVSIRENMGPENLWSHLCTKTLCPRVEIYVEYNESVDSCWERGPDPLNESSRIRILVSLNTSNTGLEYHRKLGKNWQPVCDTLPNIKQHLWLTKCLLHFNIPDT
jgi:hypothetical protein